MKRPRLSTDPPPSIVVYPDRTVCMEGVMCKRGTGTHFLNTMGFPLYHVRDEYHLIGGYGILLVGDREPEKRKLEDRERITIDHEGA